MGAAAPLIPLLTGALGAKMGASLLGSTALGGALTGPIASGINISPLVSSGLINPVTTQGVGRTIGGALGAGGGIPLANYLGRTVEPPPRIAVPSLSSQKLGPISSRQVSGATVGPPQITIGELARQQQILDRLRRLGVA